MNDYEIWMLVIGTSGFVPSFSVGNLCPYDGDRTVVSIKERLNGEGNSLKPQRFEVECNDGHIVMVINQPVMVYYRRKA